MGSTATFTVKFENLVTITPTIQGQACPGRRNVWNFTLTNVPLQYDDPYGACAANLSGTIGTDKLDFSCVFYDSTDNSRNSFSLMVNGIECRYYRGTVQFSNLSVPTLQVTPDVYFSKIPYFQSGAKLFNPREYCTLRTYYERNGRQYSRSKPSTSWRFKSGSRWELLVDANHPVERTWFREEAYSDRTNGETARVSYIEVVQPSLYEVPPSFTAEGKLIYVIRNGTSIAFRPLIINVYTWRVSQYCPASLSTVGTSCTNLSQYVPGEESSDCVFYNDYLVTEAPLQ